MKSLFITSHKNQVLAIFAMMDILAVSIKGHIWIYVLLTKIIKKELS